MDKLEILHSILKEKRDNLSSKNKKKKEIRTEELNEVLSIISFMIMQDHSSTFGEFSNIKK